MTFIPSMVGETVIVYKAFFILMTQDLYHIEGY